MAKNWQDPYVLTMSARAFLLVVHTLFGAYLWEVISSLPFDWQYITRRRKLGLASCVYFLARYMTLLALLTGVRLCNVMSADVDCTAWEYLLNASGYSAVAFTSALLYIRCIALSQRNTYVVVGLGMFYAGYWALIGYAIHNSMAVYVPGLFFCASTKSTLHRVNTAFLFSFDLTCVCVMLFFLVRGHSGGSLRKFLIQQGLMYFCSLLVAYLVATIFVTIQLNDALTQVADAFALTVAAICAMRMQRGLVEFYDPSDRSYTASSSGTVGFGRRQPRAPRTAISISVDVRQDRDESYDMDKSTRGAAGQDSALERGNV